MRRSTRTTRPTRPAGNSLALTAAALGATAALFAIARAALATPPPEGAVVLVTGGSRGLGFAIASRFAQRPVNLVLTARNQGELEGAKASLLEQHPHLTASNIHVIPADLSEPADCQRMVTEALARFGRIDVLVNNAGIIGVGPAEVMTADIFENTMRVNFLAAMQVTWAALPHLLSQAPAGGWKRRASIVNISSIGGKMAVPHMLPYTAAKFALTGFSEGLHAELRDKNIQVLTVCPGLMRTGGEDHAQFYGDVEKERAWFDFCAKTPGVSTTPEHAANKIFNAVAQGRSEIVIEWKAWFAARYAGLCPESLQWFNAIADEYLLPKP